MKKTIFYIFIFFMLLTNYKVNASSIWNVTEEQEILFNKTYKDIVSFDINNDLYILTTDNNILLYYDNEEKLNIEGIYKTSEIDQNQNYLYIATQLNIYIINLQTYKYETLNHSLNEINDIIVNDNIYLLGSKNNDACIIEIINNSLKEYLYGGINYETFKKGYFQNNKFFIVGLKDAHSENGPFANVGNINDKKSFITIINMNKEIQDTYYFNQLSNNEHITSFNIKNNYLYFILETPFNTYQYTLTTTLQEVEIYLINEQKDNIYEVITNKENNEHIYIIEEHENIRLNIYKQNTLVDSYQLNTKGIIKNVSLIDGVLYLYISSNSGIIFTTIYEYLDIPNDSLIINRLSNNYDDTEHIKIKSYFEDLYFEIKSSFPYFQNNINGEYTVTYQAIRTNAPSIVTTSKVIIEPYVNIINNGIYPKDLSLLFYGNGYLNNEKINQGYIVTNPGDYELKIIDANNNTQIYKFKIIENYYKKMNNIYIPSIIELQQDEKYNMIYTVSQEIDNVIVNNKSYDYYIKDNKLVLDFLSNTNNSIDIYNINYFEYYEHDILKQQFINQQIILRTLKNKPLINIFEQKENKNLILDLNIIDNNQTLSYIKIIIKDKEQTINTIYNYFQNETINFKNITINKPYNVLIYLGYELGGNNFYEELVINTTCEFKKYNQNNIELKTDINNNQIDNINIKILGDKTNFNEVILGTTNLTEKYQKDNNYMYIIICISLSIFIILFTIVIKFYKKRKKKGNYN